VSAAFGCEQTLKRLRGSCLARGSHRVQRLGEQHVEPARDGAHAEGGCDAQGRARWSTFSGGTQARKGVEVREALHHRVQRLIAQTPVECASALGAQLKPRERTTLSEGLRGASHRSKHALLGDAQAHQVACHRAQAVPLRLCAA